MLLTPNVEQAMVVFVIEGGVSVAALAVAVNGDTPSSGDIDFMMMLEVEYHLQN